MEKLNTNKFKFFWIKLIRGDFGLITTFWLFGIGINLIFLPLFNYLITHNISDIIILITFFIKAIYNLIIFIAIWRAANKYKGLKIWKIFAYMSVILGILLLLIEIFINLIDFNASKQLKKTNIFVPTAQIIWKKTFPISYEGAKTITKTNDGNFIIAGITANNFFIMKVNNKGDKIWKKDFKKNRYQDCSNKIIKTNDDDFVVTGIVSNDFNSLFVMKFNSKGKKIWENTYNYIVEIASIIKTNDGGFIVAGDQAGQTGEYCIIKINSKGKKIWEKTYDNIVSYNEDGDAYPISIVKTNDGDFVVGKNKTGAFVMKINNKGEKIWIKYFKKNIIDHDYIEGATAITKTNDGGFIVAIDTSTDAFIMKINNKGKKIWINKFNHLNCGTYPPTKVNSIIKTNDGGFIVAGGTGYPGSFVAKVNSNGKEIWGNCFNKADYYEGTSAIVKTNNGGFIIVGDSEFNNSLKGSFYLMKLKYEKKTLQK